MIKGELTVYKDSSDHSYQWVAKFKTDENIYHSYGKRLELALSDMWSIVESLQLQQNED